MPSDYLYGTFTSAYNTILEFRKLGQVDETTTVLVPENDSIKLFLEKEIVNKVVHKFELEKDNVVIRANKVYCKHVSDNNALALSSSNVGSNIMNKDDEVYTKEAANCFYNFHFLPAATKKQKEFMMMMVVMKATIKLLTTTPHSRRMMLELLPTPATNSVRTYNNSSDRSFIILLILPL